MTGARLGDGLVGHSTRALGTGSSTDPDLAMRTTLSQRGKG